MNPTVLLVRHGATAFNDPKNEALRGYSDIPISVEGKKVVMDASDVLRDSPWKLTRVLSSPLQRTMMTAQVIADPSQAKVIPCNGLLPWNLGKLTGTPLKESAKKLDYYQEYPDLKIPDGESYRKFYERWTQALEKMLTYAEQNPDGPLVGIVHSRNLLALPSILGDKNIGDVPVKGGPPPASITKIEKIDNAWTISVFWQEKSF